MGRERKKIVFLVFEGLSDYDALFIPLSRLYEEVDEGIEVVYGLINEKDSNREGGDITSKNGVRPDNIEAVMNKIVFMPVLNQNGIYPKDLIEVIHFVDLDGAFVPDDMITYRDDCVKTMYDDKIYTNDVDKIISRNMLKRDNLNYLSTLSEFKVGTKKIKYSVFYFSSNLDHVISNNQNLDKSLKRGNAQTFSLKVVNDTSSFRSFFEAFMPNDCSNSYLDSWEYVKHGNNSLARLSNIGNLIDRLMSGIHK